MVATVLPQCLYSVTQCPPSSLLFLKQCFFLSPKVTTQLQEDRPPTCLSANILATYNFSLALKPKFLKFKSPHDICCSTIFPWPFTALRIKDQYACRQACAAPLSNLWNVRCLTLPFDLWTPIALTFQFTDHAKP